MRRAIARRMVESKQSAPHFYTEIEIPMDRAVEYVHSAAATAGAARTTVTAVLARACALALGSHPSLNALWTEEGLLQMQDVNLGIAVALEDGLVAPALLAADKLSLSATGEALRDLVARTQSGKLRPSEISDGTFTLSNLGRHDVSRFSAIIVPPQVGILATGATLERPVVVDGQIAIGKVMTATLSADHRAVDGAYAATFLEALKALLTDPERLDD